MTSISGSIYLFCYGCETSRISFTSPEHWLMSNCSCVLLLPKHILMRVVYFESYLKCHSQAPEASVIPGKGK